jgi:hypothetical protein
MVWHGTQVDVHGLGLSITGAAAAARQLAFDFENDCLNLQLLLPMMMKLTCSSGAPLSSTQSNSSSSCFSSGPAPATSCSKDGVCVHYTDGKDISAAKSVAGSADIALIFAGTTSTEGTDRADLTLGTDDTLIAGVTADPQIGAKTAVIVVTPGAVRTDWREQAGAVLAAFMPGEAYGDAISAILFGDVSPSGRLPLTFPRIENEVNLSMAQWPGVHKSNNATPCLSWHDTGKS